MTGFSPTEAERVADEVRALEVLNMDAMREEWRRRIKTPPLVMRAPDLFRRVLADAIQAEAFGRDRELERRIVALARAHGRGETPRAPRAVFRAGTVLTREYEGRTLRVEVVEDCFVWEERCYKSLSSVARAITGVRWNGPRFFGLREAKP